MPPDRLLEARKTYDALAEASQSLTASSVKITNSLDSAELRASALTDRLERNSILARTFSEALHRPALDAIRFHDDRRVPWGVPGRGRPSHLPVGSKCGFERVGRVISRRDCAALRGAGRTRDRWLNGGKERPLVLATLR